MSNEITETENVPATHEPEQQTNMLTIIDKAVMNPEIDPDKLDKLLDINIKMMDRQAEIEFNQAIARLDFPLIPRTKKGHNGKYAPYEAMHKLIHPIYKAEGFSLRFTSKLSAQKGFTTYYVTVSHVGGHSEVSEKDFPSDDSGNKNPMQAEGSSMAYAKRYLTKAVFNIVEADEDDDGIAGGSKVITDKQREDIQDLLDETGTDVARFCKDYARVQSLSDIRANQFTTIKVALQSKKIEQMEKPDGN